MRRMIGWRSWPIIPDPQLENFCFGKHRFSVLCIIVYELCDLEIVNISKSQFPNLEDWKNNSTYFPGLLWLLNGISYVKQNKNSAWHKAISKFSNIVTLMFQSCFVYIFIAENMLFFNWQCFIGIFPILVPSSDRLF